MADTPEAAPVAPVTEAPVAPVAEAPAAAAEVAKEGITFAQRINKGFAQIAGKESVGAATRFGRVTGVGVGSAMVLDSLFRGKNSEGEDRGFAGRAVEAAAGAGVALGSLAVGHGKA